MKNKGVVNGDFSDLFCLFDYVDGDDLIIQLWFGFVGWLCWGWCQLILMCIVLILLFVFVIVVIFGLIFLQWMVDLNGVM